MHSHFVIFGSYQPDTHQLFGEEYANVTPGTPVHQTLGEIRTRSGVYDIQATLGAVGHTLEIGNPQTYVIPTKIILAIERNPHHKQSFAETFDLSGKPGDDEIIYAAARSGYNVVFVP